MSQQIISPDRQHVRTKEGKLCCVEQRLNGESSPVCVWKFNDFDIAQEFEDREIGDEISLRYVELTDEEFEALGDFEGW